MPDLSPAELVTNEEYRVARGTDHPFTATEEEVRRAWFKLNKEAILRKRMLKKKYPQTRSFTKFNAGYDDEDD